MSTKQLGILMAVIAAGCAGAELAHDAGGAPSDGDSGPTGDSGAAFPPLPSTALLIANGGDSSLALVDASSLTVIAKLPVQDGMHPHRISVSPSGDRALITATKLDLSAGHGGGAHAGHGPAGTTLVYELDLATGALNEALSIDATAHNAAYTPDGEHVVLAMMEHGMIAVYDASSYAELFSATGFQLPLEVTPTPAGALLIAESGAGRISAFDLSTQEVSSQFDVGAVPVAAWAAGDGSFFVSVEEGRVVRHMRERNGSIALDDHAIEPGGMPGQAIQTPDGTELWVAVEDAGKIAIFDADAHEPIAEVQAGVKPHGIAFSPSGDRAFITDEDGGKLLVIDVAQRTVSAELELGGKPNGIVLLASSD